jgi:hypothetical protein
MQILPAPIAEPPVRRASQVRLRPHPETGTDADQQIDRLRDCLDVAFPPSGTSAAPATLVWSRPPDAVSADGVDLTEVSFGSSVPGPELELERRSEERENLSVYRSATLRWQGVEALCLIRNISSGGLMGRLHAELMPGEPVTIEIRSGVPIAGHVAWSHGDMVGVAFDHRIEVLDVLQAPTSGEQGVAQRMPRVRISCPVSLIVDGSRHQVTLVDASQGGVKLATGILREGDEVTVTVQGLEPHRGVVRWSHDGHAGVAFLRPIAFEPLARWALERQADY